VVERSGSPDYHAVKTFMTFKRAQLLEASPSPDPAA